MKWECIKLYKTQLVLLAQVPLSVKLESSSSVLPSEYTCFKAFNLSIIPKIIHSYTSWIIQMTHGVFLLAFATQMRMIKWILVLCKFLRNTRISTENCFLLNSFKPYTSQNHFAFIKLIPELNRGHNNH